jgi:hypothetical protein
MTECEIINTFDQLTAAGGGLALCYESPSRWTTPKVSVMRVSEGKLAKTRSDAPWYDHGMKTFIVDRPLTKENKAAAFAEAQTWVALNFDERGPWKRNRMGDLVPEWIDKRFPIRRRS